MKRYKQNRKIDENASKNALAVLPAFASEEPKVNETVCRYYDGQGNYLGYTDLETTRKFLYGKLYYKTKGAYRIKKRRSYNDRNTTVTSIYEKDSCLLATQVVTRPLTAKDLIDSDDKEELTKLALETAKAWSINYYNLNEYPDEFKLLGDRNEMQKLLIKEHEEFIAARKAFIVKQFQNLIDVQTKMNEFKQETGINLDI